MVDSASASEQQKVGKEKEGQKGRVLWYGDERGREDLRPD